MNKLAIISHTEHYYNSNGYIVGWEPTIREINNFTKIFDLVYHVAPLYSEEPHLATKPYDSNKIIFIPILPSGGKRIVDKIKILFLLPSIILKIIRVINKVDCIHFRAPTNFGVFLLPILLIYKKKKKWIKYAGNWGQKEVPMSYALQRWWLKNNFNSSIVTINGSWEKQRQHVLSFDNPCVKRLEIKEGKKNFIKKFYSHHLVICFVGKDDDNKGFNSFIKAIDKIKKFDRIKEINVVGGINSNNYLSIIKKIDVSISFHGWLDRFRLNKIYEKSHLIVMPSHSEGFPKVLVEASIYGCIPVVTNISPINQYINNKENGILLDSPSIEDVMECINDIDKGLYELECISKNTLKVSTKFTYSHYIDRIRDEIINE
tara:strand:- start:2888 stop:4012 length:1125 start_codon:yes stop_codon:yes gene_type:complete